MLCGERLVPVALSTSWKLTRTSATGVTLAVCEPEGVRDGVTLGVALELSEGVDVGVCDMDGVVDGVTLAVSDEVLVSEAVDVRLVLGDGDGDGKGEKDGVGEFDGDGVGVGDDDGALPGTTGAGATPRKTLFGEDGAATAAPPFAQQQAPTVALKQQLLFTLELYAPVFAAGHSQSPASVATAT